MFLVDNRFQNLGRTNLGWSAKNMGDSICFRADVLREMGGGEGLAEDYQLRQRLLLAGVTIAYEPAAIGRGEAPRTWRQARPQRARWVRGAREASRLFARRLLAAGIRQRDGALLDGALQALLPSYSVLTAVCTTALAIHALVNRLVRPVFAPGVIAGWTASVAVLFLYPFVGLLLERAPLRAFVALLSGPLFVVWRTWLALAARIGAGHTGWIRTSHGSRIGEAG
jgi:cellulose synthase/poly-beta-1,6-N-acetylglucosamine synthase-like glycosyltransferase